MALQAPQITYRLFNGVAKIIGINGGDIGTPNPDSTYGYHGFIEGTETVVFDVVTTATTFEINLSVTSVKAGDRIVVKQYEENYGYEYSDASNAVLALVKARPPVVRRVMETGMVNIKTELEPHPVNLDPVNFTIKLYGNGVLIQDIPTSSLDYDYPLAITENTVLTAVIQNADESVSSPSEPERITYTDSPQASSFTVIGSDIIKIISESFNFIDNLTNNRALMRFTSSTINSSDLYKNIRNRFKTISSSISLSENIGKLQAIIEQIIYKIINDNVRLIEVKNRTMSKIRIIGNQIGLTDGYKKLRGLFKSVSDSLGISDIWRYIVAKFIPNRRKSLDYKVTMQPLRYKAEVDTFMGEYKNGVYYFSVGESQEIPITVASTDGSEFTIEDATFELVYNGTVLANGDAVLDDKTVFKLINFITPGTNQELKYKYNCVPVDVNKSAETLITRIPISVRN